MTLRRHCAGAAIVLGGAAGIIGWIGIIGAWRYTELFAQDWIVYYSAARAYFTGHLALVFDAARFTAYQFAILRPWYIAPPELHPWLYPPIYLLFLLPFGVLPFILSYLVFVGGSGFAAIAAVAWRGPGRSVAWPRGIMLLCFPASCIEALTGQNAFLSAALLIAGLRGLERVPWLAGAALGALAYKPQLWLMVPAVLLAARTWRATAATALVMLALGAASLVLFGAGAWQMWFDQTVRARDPSFTAWFDVTFLRGYSPYVCLMLLGVPGRVAALVQGAVAVAAAAGTYRAWRSGMPLERRIAATLAAAILAAPHLQAYDMVLLAAAILLLFDAAAHPAALLLYAAAWLLPLFRPFLVSSGRLLIPTVLAGMLLYALAPLVPRARTAAPT